MQTLVLRSDSESDLKLLMQLAQKLGIEVKFLTEEEKEDLGMLNAINEGRTGEYIHTSDFLKNLRE